LKEDELFSRAMNDGFVWNASEISFPLVESIVAFTPSYIEYYRSFSCTGDPSSERGDL